MHNYNWYLYVLYSVLKNWI